LRIRSFREVAEIFRSRDGIKITRYRPAHRLGFELGELSIGGGDEICEGYEISAALEGGEGGPCREGGFCCGYSGIYIFLGGLVDYFYFLLEWKLLNIRKWVIGPLNLSYLETYLLLIACLIWMKGDRRFHYSTTGETRLCERWKMQSKSLQARTSPFMNSLVSIGVWGESVDAILVSPAPDVLC